MTAYQPVVRVCGTRWRRDFIIVCIIVEQKKCFDTVDARYKHEDEKYGPCLFSDPSVSTSLNKQYLLNDSSCEFINQVCLSSCDFILTFSVTWYYILHSFFNKDHRFHTHKNTTTFNFIQGSVQSRLIRNYFVKHRQSSYFYANHLIDQCPLYGAYCSGVRGFISHDDL
jgi:hypothetical protein